MGVHFMEQSSLTTIDESDNTTFNGARRDPLAAAATAALARLQDDAGSYGSSSVVSSISEASSGSSTTSTASGNDDGPHVRERFFPPSAVVGTSEFYLAVCHRE